MTSSSREKGRPVVSAGGSTGSGWGCRQTRRTMPTAGTLARRTNTGTVHVHARMVAQARTCRRTLPSAQTTTTMGGIVNESLSRGWWLLSRAAAYAISCRRVVSCKVWDVDCVSVWQQLGLDALRPRTIYRQRPEQARRGLGKLSVWRCQCVPRQLHR